MPHVWTAWQSRFVKDEEGVTMVEYALLVAVIALVVISGALFLGTEVSDGLSEVGTTLEGT